MRNSNKLLALALAAALALGTTATAFAAEDGKDSKGETTPTNTTAPADTDKKDETTPADGEEKKDETPAAPKFTDVAAGSPFAKAIDWAVAGGITNGTTPTTFGPGNDCTVSHILTFLWRANGSPSPPGAILSPM